MDNAVSHPLLALEGLRTVQDQIKRATAAARRPADTVKLIAASKTVGSDILEQVIAAGHLVYGENRVQEAKSKWPELMGLHSEVELHLIGPLQSNKIRQALDLFHVIHSLDRLSLAEALAKEIARIHHVIQLLIQVNTGSEPQKAGIMPQEADAFIDQCREKLRLPVIGLMCIPPAGEPPEPHFEALATIAKSHGLTCLSMGMSSDYVQAIGYGATHVRVGSAIFGARLYQAQN